MDCRISKLLSIDEAKYGCVRNPLDDPREIGCYSVDARKCQHYDRSQMKYYIRRNDRNLHLDLNSGYEKDVKKVYDRVQVMDELLRWIVNSRFEPLHEYATHFVCTRGVIEAFLHTPYVDGFTSPICACRLDDVIYMNIVDTFDRAELESAASEFEKRLWSWGFKFEQYMTADRPDGIPDITSTTHQLEKFSVVIKNKIGSYNLLMEGEIDAIDPSSPHPGNGDPSCYVELKTSKLIPNFKSTDVFQRSKSLGWWMQSACTGIEKIICGMRDDQGIVRQIETVNTSDLPFLCKNKWSQRICVNYCYNVLDYLRRRMTVNDPRIVYKWEYDGESDVSVTRVIDPQGPFKIIPDWYVTELQKN